MSTTTLTFQELLAEAETCLESKEFARIKRDILYSICGLAERVSKRKGWQNQGTTMEDNAYTSVGLRASGD